MAKKQSFLLLHSSFLVCMTLVGVMGVGLTVFQQVCLNNRDYTFLAGGTCMSDSRSRALLAAAFTVMTAIISRSIGKAAVAFRTAKLSTGIPEGGYIALGASAQGTRYIARAIKCGRGWAMPVLLVMLAAHSQSLVQTLANLGIQSSQVYVKNRGTAFIANTTLSYTAIQESIQFFYGDRLDDGVDYTAVVTLASLQQYRLTESSTLSNTGAVVTNVISDGYLVGYNQTMDDVSNAFRHRDVIATITTYCESTSYQGPAGKLITATSNAAAFNVSYSADSALFVVYNIAYAFGNTSDSESQQELLEVSIKQTFGQLACDAVGECAPFNLSTLVSGTVSHCYSNLTLAMADITYTLAKGFPQVSRLKSFEPDVWEVNVYDFSNLLGCFVIAPEFAAYYLSALYVSGFSQLVDEFPVGLFNVNQENYLHAKLCAAASVSLSASLSTATMSSTAYPSSVGNPLLQNSTTSIMLPLYNLVIQPYVSTPSMALIVGILVGAAWLICIVGMVFAHLAVININAPVDSSLLYSIEKETMSRKRQTLGVSNDPQLQCRMAFDPSALMFCREAVSYSGPIGDKLLRGKRVTIAYGTAAAPPPGDLPNTRYDYW